MVIVILLWYVIVILLWYVIVILLWYVIVIPLWYAIVILLCRSDQPGSQSEERSRIHCRGLSPSSRANSPAAVPTAATRPPATAAAPTLGVLPTVPSTASLEHSSMGLQAGQAAVPVLEPSERRGAFEVPAGARSVATPPQLGRRGRGRGRCPPREQLGGIALCDRQQVLLAHPEPR